MKYYFGSQKSYNKIIPYQANHDHRNYIIVTIDPAIALISSIHTKHKPFLVVPINKYIFIIEYDKNAFDLFKTNSYLYEIEYDGKIYQNDWNYDLKKEFEIHKTINYSTKIKIINVFKQLKKYDYVKFVKYNTFDNFIMRFIPKTIYEPSVDESQFFYHGSRINIKDNYLKPLVLAKLKTAALKFSVGGITNTVIWGSSRNYVWLLESIPNLFSYYKTSGWLYYVNPSNFKLRIYPEYLSRNKVKIIKKEKIDNVFNEIKKQENSILITFSSLKKFLLSLI